LGVTIEEEAEITGVPLHKLDLEDEAVVVGISDTGGKFIVPDGSDVIRKGDKIYVLGSARTLKNISSMLHHEKKQFKQVTILGGGLIGLQLARLLEESKQPFNIKLIEKDMERCDYLCRHLNQTLVLQGDATEIAMLKEEDIAHTDVIVAATGDDPSNIVAALLARQFGVKEIVCEVMKPQYVAVYNTLGINALINPRLLAASQILRLTRREEVVALSLLQDEKAEVVEVVLPESSKVANSKIADAHFPKGMVIGSIVRNGEVFVPDGETVLLPEDHLVIFAMRKISTTLDRFFAPAAARENREYYRNKVVKND